MELAPLVSSFLLLGTLVFYSPRRGIWTRQWEVFELLHRWDKLISIKDWNHVYNLSKRFLFFYQKEPKKKIKIEEK